MATLFHALRLKLQLLLLVTSFKLKAVRFALTLRPIAGADGEEEPKSDPEPDPAPAAAEADEDPEAADDPDPEDEPRKEPNWKQMARKHEREKKQQAKELRELRDKLAARDDKDKSEHEKAIEEVEQRVRQDVESKFEKERREDRLELATTKLASRGVTVGDGKDAKRLKFADPDDAMVHLDRAIRNGDVDQDDIFDEDGKVRSEALEEALSELLERKPHLVADGKPKVEGSADAGKGGPTRTDSNVDDHLQKIRRHTSSKGQEGARFRKAA